MTYRIGLDARFAVRKRRGIGNYSLELIRAFARSPRGFEFYLFTDGPDSESVLPVEYPFHQVRLRPSIYPLWEQIALPIACQLLGIDLLHCLGMTSPWALPPRTRLITSIHDVIYMLPKGQFGGRHSAYQSAGRLYRRINIPPIARKASHIITISEFSSVEIQKYLSGVPASKITVTPLAVSTSFMAEFAKVQQQDGFNIPFLLHLGGDDPRKNTLTVIHSYLEVRKTIYPDIQELVIAGLSTKCFTSMINTLPEMLRIEAMRHIRLTGFVSEAELVRLYRHAEGLLFPSKFEGFGIPILEAMGCGVPVITSSVTSLPEVAGGAAILVDPESVSSLCQAIVDLIHKPGEHGRCTAAGLARASLFTWDRTGGLTLDVYENALSPR